MAKGGSEEGESWCYSLEKLNLYETRARYYLIGSDRNKRFFRVLKIDRMEPSDLNKSQDPVVYPPQEVKSLLHRIAEGNRASGGCIFVNKVYGIAGCIKLLESYYLILVTKRKQIGSICGHAIYSIHGTQILTIPHVSVQTDLAHSKTELRNPIMATYRCGKLAVIRTSWTDNNPGRRFYACPSPEITCPGFVCWFDPPMCPRAVRIIPGLLRACSGPIKKGMN